MELLLHEPPLNCAADALGDPLATTVPLKGAVARGRLLSMPLIEGLPLPLPLALPAPSAPTPPLPLAAPLPRLLRLPTAPLLLPLPVMLALGSKLKDGREEANGEEESLGKGVGNAEGEPLDTDGATDAITERDAAPVVAALAEAHGDALTFRGVAVTAAAVPLAGKERDAAAV